MSHHPSDTRDRILAAPAPRDIEWTRFIAMWKEFADEVKEESGDRLAVDMNGHREVFRRQKDGLVGIEDVERARHLFRSHESTEGSGTLFVVTVTDEDAHFYDFDLSAHDVETDEHSHQKNPDSRGHHMRTVEKKTGRDDEADEKRFFDDLAEKLREDSRGRGFVVLGHGKGKSDAAAGFVARLHEKHGEIAAKLIAEGSIDLSAAGEPEIEKKAQELAGR